MRDLNRCGSNVESPFYPQVKLMTAAKSKVAELERELDRSKKEYANTRDSAVRAAEAAKEAQINANQNSKWEDREMFNQNHPWLLFMVNLDTFQWEYDVKYECKWKK